MPRRSKYIQSRLDEIVYNWLKDRDVKVSVSRKGVHYGEHGSHYDYQLTLKRYGKKATFLFHDSVHNFYENKRPSLWEILHAVLNDYFFRESEGIESWIDMLNYGYDEKEAKRVYRALERQEEKLERLFTEGELWELDELIREGEDRGLYDIPPSKEFVIRQI